MSEWGWHSFPNTENFKLEETYQYYDVEGRKVPYAIQWREPGRKQDAANYFRENPHRLHLGVFGFELHHSDKSEVKPEDIANIKQKLDLWTGIISSSFEIDGEKTEVETCADHEKDRIAVQVNSEMIKNGTLGFKLRLPYPTGDWGGDACNWEKTDLHHSEIIRQNENSAIIKHSIDTTTYFIQLNWSGNASLTEKEPHVYVLNPGKESPAFSASVEFNSENTFAEKSEFEDVKNSSVSGWETFWKSGGAVDFSGTEDSKAKELERRVVLSQYLTRVNCAGNFPPQETGLTYNSWYGKPHLEMHWWHGVHFAYWNRTELARKKSSVLFSNL